MGTYGTIQVLGRDMLTGLDDPLSFDKFFTEDVRVKAIHKGYTPTGKVKIDWHELSLIEALAPDIQRHYPGTQAGDYLVRCKVRVVEDEEYDE